jgi:hypothetical protein
MTENTLDSEKLQGLFEKAFRGRRLHALPPKGGTRTWNMPKGSPTWLDASRGWQEKQPGCNFYFSPVRFKPGSTSSTKPDVQSSSWLWLDLDPREGQPLDKERATMLWLLTGELPNDVPTPTFVINSGRGYWGLWRLKTAHVFDGPNGDATRAFEATLRGLANAFGEYGDRSVINSNRIVRLPGTINTKTGQSAAVVEFNSVGYTLADFPSIVIERKAASQDGGDPLSIELIERMLKATPYVGGPDGLADRREQKGWLDFMMAVHEASSGDPEAASLFIAWSQDDPEYTGDSSAETIQARWDSLDSEAVGGLTRGSWIKLLKSLPDNGELISEIMSMTAEDDFDGDAPETLADKPGAVPPSGSDGEWGVIRKTFVHFGKQERFFSLNDWEMWKATAFDNHFAAVNVMGKETKNLPLSKHIFRNRLLPMFRSICFEPGNTAKNVNGGRFNMWVPSDIVAKKGDTTIFDAHMLYLFPDPLDRKHVLNWLAWVYRNQDKKPRHALLVHGELTGTGKSFLAYMMRRLLGKKLPNGIFSNSTMIKGTTLDAAHGGWEWKTKLLIVEEVRPGFGSSQAVIKGLHELISEPTIYVDQKNLEPEEIPNYIAAILFSNKDNALAIENNERRYLIVSVDAAGKLLPKSAEYYVALYGLLDDDKAMAAIAYQLEKRDLEGYSGESAAPLTVAKDKMAEETRDELSLWFDEHMRSPPLSYQLVTLDEVLAIVPKDVAHVTKGLRKRLTDLMRDRLNAENLDKVRLGGRNEAEPRMWRINKETRTPTNRYDYPDKRLSLIYRGERGKLTPAEKTARDALAIATARNEFAADAPPTVPVDELADLM